MPRSFTTLEVIKITGVNRNTFYSALRHPRKYIVPDVHVAANSNDKSLFSLEAAYNVALFFRMTQSGLSRGAAGHYLGMDPLGVPLCWDNVGDDPQQVRLMEIVVKIPGPGSKKQWGISLLPSPSTPMDNEFFRWTVVLPPIKRAVDANAAKLLLE